MSKESSEEYFSSRREIECLDVVTGSEGAEYFSPVEDSDANLKTVDGSGEIAVSEAKNGAAFGPKEEKEQIGRKEDDGMHHIVKRSNWINGRIDSHTRFIYRFNVYTCCSITCKNHFSYVSFDPTTKM